LPDTREKEEISRGETFFLFFDLTVLIIWPDRPKLKSLAKNRDGRMAQFRKFLLNSFLLISLAK